MRNSLGRLMGVIVLTVLAVGGCASQELSPKNELPPTPHLDVVSVQNDFDERYLPDVTQFLISGHRVAEYRLELRLIENGSTPERARLDVPVPDSSAIQGRVSLIRTSRPDPDKNPRALFPQEIYGFRLAARLEGMSPESLTGRFEVWEKHQGDSQVRSRGAVSPERPQVLLVQWYEPLFADSKEGFRSDDPPPTLKQIMQRTATDPKVSAVVLVLTWNRR